MKEEVTSLLRRDIPPIKPHCITSQVINICYSLRSYYNSQNYISSESCFRIKMLSEKR